MYSTNLRLKYLFPTLPTLADRNAEAGVGDWTGTGNHAITQSNTYAHSGTYAFKIHATGVGDASNYVKLGSAYIPSFIGANQYCITFWFYASAPITMFMAVAGDSGLSVGLPAGVGTTWTPVSYTFTGVSGAVDFKAYLSGAADVWMDDITVSQYTDLNALVEKGMSDPDMFELFPAIQNNYIDGTIETQFTKFRRKISFYVGVVQNRSDRLGILYWMLDNSRQIDYLTEYQVPVTPNWHNSGQTSGEYSNVWEQNFVGARSFTFEILESIVRTTFPV